MSDLFVAMGLVLVIEGLLWALAPDMAQRLLEMARETPQSSLRAAGWAAVLVGAAIVWLVRG
jgi:uncharacterized protein YjeT (DUF2065 family)